MQQKFMSTDMFLRLEREWQRMRHARYNLEIEAVPPDEGPLDDMAGRAAAAAPAKELDHLARDLD